MKGFPYMVSFPQPGKTVTRPQIGGEESPFEKVKTKRNEGGENSLFCFHLSRTFILLSPCLATILPCLQVLFFFVWPGK